MSYIRIYYGGNLRDISNILGLDSSNFSNDLNRLISVYQRGESVNIFHGTLIRINKEIWEYKEWTQWGQTVPKPSFEELANAVGKVDRSTKQESVVNSFLDTLTKAIKTPVAITGLNKRVEGHTLEKIPNIANIITRHKTSTGPREFPPIHLSDVDGEHINLSTITQAQEYHDTLMYRANDLHNAHESIERDARVIFKKLEDASLTDPNYQTILDTYDTEIQALADAVESRLEVVIDKHIDTHHAALVNALEMFENMLAEQTQILVQAQTILGSTFVIPPHKPFVERIAQHAQTGRKQMNKLAIDGDLDIYKKSLKVIVNMRVQMIKDDVKNGLKLDADDEGFEQKPARFHDVKITVKDTKCIVKWDVKEVGKYDLYRMDAMGNITVRTHTATAPNHKVSVEHDDANIKDAEVVGYSVVEVLERPNKVVVPMKVELAVIEKPAIQPIA